MADVTIYTSRTCGWAVRNYAALIEKGVAFDTVPAKSSDGTKLDEFLALTPYEKTPVLRFGNTAVFESRLINEFIDDQFPSPRLMPSDPAGRCEARKWMHYCEDRLIPALTEIARTVDSDKRAIAINDFGKNLEWFTANGLPAGWQGPYFFGEDFSLLDLVFFTLFGTARELEQLLGVSLLAQDTALQRWASRILARPSLREAEKIRKELEF